MRYKPAHLPLCLCLAATLSPPQMHADPVPVRNPQGASHGFLALSTLDGKRLAIGDATNTVHGRRITSRVVLHFRDGSIDDDTTVFSQSGTFHLISDRHVQRGPSFPNPSDVLIQTSTGQVTWRDKDGKLNQEHVDLPADLSNGLPPNLLLNLLPSTPETKISYLVLMPKPRVIHLSVKPAGRVPFTIGGLRREAVDYALHIELGGIIGVVAPILGKQPSDFHIWILPGPAPAFIREEGEMYLGGPVWRIEQISPTFPK